MIGSTKFNRRFHATVFTVIVLFVLSAGQHRCIVLFCIWKQGWYLHSKTSFQFLFLLSHNKLCNILGQQRVLLIGWHYSCFTKRTLHRSKMYIDLIKIDHKKRYLGVQKTSSPQRKFNYYSIHLSSNHNLHTSTKLPFLSPHKSRHSDVNAAHFQQYLLVPRYIFMFTCLSEARFLLWNLLHQKGQIILFWLVTVTVWVQILLRFSCKPVYVFFKGSPVIVFIIFIFVRLDKDTHHVYGVSVISAMIDLHSVSGIRQL